MEQLDVKFTADTADLDNGINGVVNAVDAMFKTLSLKSGQAKTPVVELFGTLQSASDRAITGLVRGTETWQKALFNVTTAVESKFLQLFSHMLINAVETQLGMTDATVAGNAARTASDQAASGISLAAQAQKAVSAILNDSAQVFSGIFAFLSPEMGPAAAVPAAAGSASVAALASGITYAESGAWNIPSNTLAYLHAGEMVVPRPFASSLRDEGNGFSRGGDSYAITINAIDTQTGAQFLKNNAPAIAAALSSQARNFNRNVPSWKS